MKHYEAIVVGCGGLGSAALYWLSRELGGSVLGIEQFKLGHGRGASQDHSRIIRLEPSTSPNTQPSPRTLTRPTITLKKNRGCGYSTRPGGSL